LRCFNFGATRHSWPPDARFVSEYAEMYHELRKRGTSRSRCRE
jgi:hypothetical protein